jgi:hypothetical protein
VGFSISFSSLNLNLEEASSAVLEGVDSPTPSLNVQSCRIDHVLVVFCNYIADGEKEIHGHILRTGSPSWKREATGQHSVNK